MDTVLVFADEERAREGGMATSEEAGRLTGMDAWILADSSSRPSREPTWASWSFGPWGLLGTEDCGSLLERRDDPGAPVNPDARLDVLRARRLDRAARLGAVAVERALSESGGPAPHPTAQGGATEAATGLVLGSAFGNVDGTAAFMHRIFEKGARAAGPAQSFPTWSPARPSVISRFTSGSAVPPSPRRTSRRAARARSLRASSSSPQARCRGW